jgi:CheY-like chemotaxis protein
LAHSAPAGASPDSIPGTLDAPTRGAPASDWICVAAARDILVVDDNDRHLDILNTILSSVGHDVEICGSGAEAIRRLEMRRFDVVVLDIVMPEVGGLVVAREMREGRLNRRTPIIACTANMAMARQQLEEVPGVSAIIGKPIDTANLILAVARAPVRDRKADRIRV